MSRLLTLKQYFSSDSTAEPRSEKRQAWINRLTFAALVFALTWAFVYPYITPYRSVDFDVFLDAATKNDMGDYYYAPWLLPFYRIFGLFPHVLARALGNVLNVFCFLYAIHVFKGSKIFFLTSYSLMFSIFYGQIDGMYALGLAWMFIGLKRQNVVMVSLAWMLAGAKFYIGIPLGFGLLWCYGETMELRAKVVLMTIFWVLVSFVIWPNWVPELIERIRVGPPHSLYSIDTWALVGPVVVVLWVPVLLSRTNNYLWWVATWVLTVPYLHIHGLNQLLIFPIGPIGWLIQINYFAGFSVAYFLLVIPLWVYLKAWWESWRTDWLSVGLQSLFHRSENRAPQVIPIEVTSSAD